jgi:hypothetical protein
VFGICRVRSLHRNCIRVPARSGTRSHNHHTGHHRKYTITRATVPTDPRHCAHDNTSQIVSVATNTALHCAAVVMLSLCVHTLLPSTQKLCNHTNITTICTTDHSPVRLILKRTLIDHAALRAARRAYARGAVEILARVGARATVGAKSHVRAHGEHITQHAARTTFHSEVTTTRASKLSTHTKRTYVDES